MTFTLPGPLHPDGVSKYPSKMGMIIFFASVGILWIMSLCYEFSQLFKFVDPGDILIIGAE
jgi:hypothetical protein